MAVDIECEVSTPGPRASSTDNARISAFTMASLEYLPIPPYSPHGAVKPDAVVAPTLQVCWRC